MMKYIANIGANQTLGIKNQLLSAGDAVFLSPEEILNPGLKTMIRNGVLVLEKILKPPHKVLIVGCGHSGTMHIAWIFQQLGLDIQHEKIGADGSAHWGYTHITRSLLLLTPKFGLSPDTIILHQVRHPLNVISSVQAMEDETWLEVGARAAYRERIWNPLDDPHPIRGMKYWILWNAFAEELASYRYRVESLPEVFDELLEKIGMSPQPLPVLPPDTNKHNYSYTYTWDDLYKADDRLCCRVKDLSELYGYEPVKDMPSIWL